MTNELHITNGDSAASLMREAGIPGHILPWRDILHDGPVPSGLSLDQLAEIRARFLHQPPAANYEEILQDIHQRDQTLKDFNQFDTVTLWLEHDLYDQLQLLQLLHFFAQNNTNQSNTAANKPIHLICINQFPGIEPFYGLGQLNPEQMASLQGTKKPITPKQLELGRQGWLAFTADTPLELLAFIQQDLTALPFLKAALIRHLEEFPDSQTGLSRHERQALELIQAGTDRPGRLFGEHQLLETAPYLGDWSYWSLLQQLTNSPNALLETATGKHFVRPPDVPNDTFLAQRLSLTPLGLAVLRGEADWTQLNPPDRWKGGVHLHPDKMLWRWNAEQQTIEASQAIDH